MSSAKWRLVGLDPNVSIMILLRLSKYVVYNSHSCSSIFYIKELSKHNSPVLRHRIHIDDILNLTTV